MRKRKRLPFSDKVFPHYIRKRPIKKKEADRIEAEAKRLPFPDKVFPHYIRKRPIKEEDRIEEGGKASVF